MSHMRNTSANIDGVFILNLHEASTVFHLSKDTVFKDLIFLTIRMIRPHKKFGCLIEYQNHHPEHWNKLYYSLDADEVEELSIIRQKYKISISKLAFIGFLSFWHLLMQTYKMRISRKIIINFNTYTEYCERLQRLLIIYQKNLNIIQKE